MGTWSPGRIRLVFPEGHPQHGLEVVMRRQRIGEVLTDLTLPAPVTREELDGMTREQQQAELARLSEKNIREFAGLVVEWNLVDDDGNPVEIGYDGVLLLDNDTFEAVSEAYTNATRKVAPPLPQPSDGGAPSAEELTLPMEPL